ncbi:hypothetical protein A2X44_02050 [candidate division CPR3 bacterium GWF2_35_18]|uniref:Adenosine specific kinase n=1 Tax=candidate division CPR3 bacterium GW2011_GWF2_35_18 TaxID=1618350 RepID=A0A0G0BKE4_UNCC3|nr:MAG: hypothetical protein UR67_C0002G0094 [candidate division CPR3 bacterium GW2011_GWF2_35_18]KKP86377.1 MAG: hypothetical protein UR87_C0021G0006 [candidate division CPR3 bacterium GW2011_GWE2_35_7]OGB62782.1 MAG: hypothetical protein A2X44_02050 [candidate division CPR3 bacterium GWF2_35_18]OGB65363.1 MAG: hypothetical protein A2250_00265 [candidate division CPR3 bacterium RIFOXYA2_FULL_35_13]OGB76287.1 MAG: hypothetical protein A2476_02765 [candidate division CPR3 bacterium RIFOXYC2_FULL
MDLQLVKIKNPNSLNLILGQSHFIKTVEDLHETLVNCIPGIKFGLAFAEASGPCLIRYSGTDQKLTDLSIENMKTLSCGHSFIIFLKDSFPINVLPRIKEIPEVVHIFCATANPVEVIITETKLGRGIMGVIDGGKSQGIENEKDVKKRKEFLREIGYKL